MSDSQNTTDSDALDELTGIPNPTSFRMLAENSLAICQRQDVPATLVYCDLNNFRPINDTWGRSEGDRALRVFAEGLKTSFRDSDLIGRLGGDEFAVLLTSTGRELSAAVMEKFREALNLYNKRSGCEYNICFSSGMVEYDPARHETVETMLAEANEQLQEARKQRYSEVSRDLPRIQA